MHVDVIDEWPRLLSCRQDWEAVYRRDPEAQVFLSWTWMSTWLRQLDGRWLVLAAKKDVDSGVYQGFFPLRLKTGQVRDGGFQDDLMMAGNRGADYTGFIIDPAVETQVIPAFAGTIKSRRWSRLNLEFVRMSPARLELLLSQFPADRFRIRPVSQLNEVDNVDNCICPCVSLPDDWDAYLGTLGSNTRQKIRRYLRKVDQDPTLELTVADRHTIERDLNILLQLWERKWAHRKGETIKAVLNVQRRLLLDMHRQDALFMPVLWHRGVPTGALAILLDIEKRSMRFLMGARDESAHNPPPGVVLHAYSIRAAIELGWRTYDFLRGNEPYKYDFGARDQKIHHFLVMCPARSSSRSDRSGVQAVLERTMALDRSGHGDRAMAGYRQILDWAPDCREALLGLARRLMARGDHAAARAFLERLVAIEPDTDVGWLRLGRCYEAERRFTEAADAYRQVLKRSPSHAMAHNNIGHALHQLGRYGQAVEALESALACQPDYAEAALNLGNALVMHASTAASTDRSQGAGCQTAAKGSDAETTLSKAVDQYRSAIRLKPNLVEAHYGLGVAYRRQGALGSARRSFRTVLELDPGHRDAARALADLPEQPDGFVRSAVPAQ